MKDVEEGRNGVKAGVIGEIGCNYPLTDEERRCLIAASKAQVTSLLGQMTYFLLCFVHQYGCQIC